MEQSLDELEKYPEEELIDIIMEVGFNCNCCARCCTSQFNDHVFLLAPDVENIKNISPDALKPAPYFEFCDKEGTFYVCGYALKTKEDGTCIFLKDKRCTIYGSRPAICRLYPYMLHKEADENGNIDWRQISGLNQHGTYHNPIGKEDATQIAKDIKQYERAYLEQQIKFLNTVHRHFHKNKLRHVQRVYDRQMREHQNGACVKVMVYDSGRFKEHTV